MDGSTLIGNDKEVMCSINLEALLVHINLEISSVDVARWNFVRKMFVVDAVV
jgi:hypothetical protein